MAGLAAGGGIGAALDIAAGDPIGEVDGRFLGLEKADTAMPVPPSAEPTGPLEPATGMSAKVSRCARKPAIA